MSDYLIERLRKPHRQIHRSTGRVVEKSSPAIQHEAADALAAKDTALAEMRAERDEARASWKQAVDLYEMEAARVDPALAALKETTARATAAEAELGRTRKALEAGRQLANAAYNICQQGWPSDVPSFASLREAYETWDDVLSAARALAPSIQDETDLGARG